MTSVPASSSLGRGWAAEFQACLSLGWPLVLTNAIEMALTLTSTAMIGRIGPDALAASTLGLALFNLCLLFGIGVTGAVSALIAREAGRDAGAAAIRHIVHQGLWGAFLIAVPMWVVLWNAEPIFLLLGQEPALAAGAARYLHVLQWSLLPALDYLVLRAAFAALDRPRWAVGTGLLAVAINFGLNWLLIGGHRGLPAWGLVGSGLATLLSNIFMAATLVAIALTDPRLRRYRVFAGLLRLPTGGFLGFWRLGLPIGISVVLEVGMFSGAAVMVGRFDAASLAAHAIALQVAGFMFMIPLGLSQAATIRVGRALGAADHTGIVRAGWTALCLGLLSMIGSAGLLLGIPHLIIGTFVNRAEPGSAAAEAIATTLLGLAGLFQIADGAQVVLGGMLRGLHDARVPMLISGLGYWGVGLPLGALFAFWLDFRAPGVWMGMTAGLFTAAALLLLRWLQLSARCGVPHPAS